MQKKIDIPAPKLPYNFGDIVDKHLQVLKQDEVYAGYSLDAEYRIVKGHCKIASDGMWDSHNNEDDSNLVMFFREEVVKDWTPKWFSLSLEEVKQVQKEQVDLLTEAMDMLKQAIKLRLGNVYSFS